MKKYFTFIFFIPVILLLNGCLKETDIDSTLILLSDDVITVNGEEISINEKNSVYVGADIIYYEEGQDDTYGEGTVEDAHSKEEADMHTVVTITKPGVYKVSGKLSYGQIAIDLGKDVRDNEEAVVTLILDNAEINCSVAPAIIVYHAYECGSSKKKDATPYVNTDHAGFHLILAKDSKNYISGSYVAKIYKDDTTMEEVNSGDAKKKYKFDGAIHSEVSFTINAEENGKLNVKAENEGITGALHMTINCGYIMIDSCNDAFNTNEEKSSVFTVNGGTLLCNSGFGKEGDGIDSNGYIVINDGFILSCAHSDTEDKGLDSDEGIYIHGGEIIATGNDYDEISEESKQGFFVFELTDKISAGEIVLITDKENHPLIAYQAINDYSILIYSQSEIKLEDYYFYKVSSVTGNLKNHVYTDITDFQDAKKIVKK